MVLTVWGKGGGGYRWKHPKLRPPLLGLLIEQSFDSCSVGKAV